MKAEDNVVDNWIKQSVRREILYRLVVWCLITVIALFISSNAPTFALDKYVTPVIHKLIEQLDFIWAFLYFFITISFFFKDMAYMRKESWGNHNIRHNFGMLLRKFTCEALLWSAGISSSLVTIITISFPIILLKDDNSTTQNYFLSIFIIFSTFTFSAMILSLYYFLRADRPAIYQITNSRLLTQMIYLFLFLGCGVMYFWIEVK
ncbi:TPA: hypothetical protein ACR8QZ_003839 [Enterobacter roggenkampii]|uniref:hypothetical protein n=1 Tax=Enterobacter TaxID=547 RepID=UPI000650D21A|nr:MULTISPECIES: hypothetical protein [Enterobacter]KLW60670.1 hypothetical protein SK58_03299 [Enterobacter sp. BIDMC93]KZQ07285.1 hypothetical protein A3461_09040 [Enterobacter roggenkampii]MDU2080510.1 hypothetical protein [Enterobacter sp.]HDT2127357.1 hypothetical protein [Enterobacter roggenkampii]